MADAKALEGAALKAAIKKQVEYYFSKSNLESDSFLVSRMDAQMCVPITVIAGFAKVKAFDKKAAKYVTKTFES